MASAYLKKKNVGDYQDKIDNVLESFICKSFNNNRRGKQIFQKMKRSFEPKPEVSQK